MIKTGVFATDEEKAELLRLSQRARGTPVMLIGGMDISADAWRQAQQTCHKYALAHGLPEIPGYYGITNDGEFVRT